MWTLNCAHCAGQLILRIRFGGRQRGSEGRGIVKERKVRGGMTGRGEPFFFFFFVRALVQKGAAVHRVLCMYDDF